MTAMPAMTARSAPANGPRMAQWLLAAAVSTAVAAEPSGALAQPVKRGLRAPTREAPSAVAPGATRASTSAASSPAQPPTLASLGVRARIEQLTAQTVIVRTGKSAPTELGASLTKATLALVAAATTHNLDIAGAPCARFTNDGDKVSFWVALPIVAPPTTPARQLRVETLSSGTALVADYDGPHVTLPTIRAALRAEAGARGVAHLLWEQYLTNPILEPDPAKQRTRLVLPLRAE